ncbi:MAG: AraC family transcriptional regulator [Eubacteriales bacterium]|nr:AraC family transcriptional regulator [Eubacteriales bacterium]
MKKNLQTAFSTRQYMLSKDFEIYYYKESRFSGVKSHTHDYYEFYFFLEGDISMQIGGLLCPLKPGDVLLIPPHTMHHAVSRQPEQPYRRFVFWISQDYLRQLCALSPSYGYVFEQAQENGRFLFHYDNVAFNALQGKIFRLIEEIHSDRFGKEAQTTLCVSDLILHLNRTIYEMDHPATQPGEQSLYENLIQYIEGHLEEELTLDRLAGVFYVSKYHIAHVFKEHLGLSVHQYITKKRLAMCRDAILGNTGISKAYLLYGFKDYSSFFRAFRKEYGISPREYKELYTVVSKGAQS